MSRLYRQAKPVDQEQFITIVRSIGDFWFEIVRLPADGKS
jgi:hypothetical protein